MYVPADKPGLDPELLSRSRWLLGTYLAVAICGSLSCSAIGGVIFGWDCTSLTYGGVQSCSAQSDGTIRWASYAVQDWGSSECSEGELILEDRECEQALYAYHLACPGILQTIWLEPPSMVSGLQGCQFQLAADRRVPFSQPGAQPTIRFDGGVDAASDVKMAPVCKVTDVSQIVPDDERWSLGTREPVPSEVRLKTGEWYDAPGVVPARYVCVRPIMGRMCEPAWVQQPGANRCYKRHADPLIHSAAKLACRQAGAQLAIVRSARDTAFLQAYVGRWTVWIGLEYSMAALVGPNRQWILRCPAILDYTSRLCPAGPVSCVRPSSEEVDAMCKDVCEDLVCARSIVEQGAGRFVPRSCRSQPKCHLVKEELRKAEEGPQRRNIVYMIDNSALQSTNQSLPCYKSPNLEDRDPSMTLEFGSIQQGVRAGKDGEWVEINQCFIPREVNGYPVLHMLNLQADQDGLQKVWSWAGAKGHEGIVGVLGHWQGYSNWAASEPNGHLTKLNEDAAYLNHWTQLGMPAPFRADEVEAARTFNRQMFRNGALMLGFLKVAIPVQLFFLARRVLRTGNAGAAQCLCVMDGLGFFFLLGETLLLLLSIVTFQMSDMLKGCMSAPMVTAVSCTLGVTTMLQMLLCGVAVHHMQSLHVELRAPDEPPIQAFPLRGRRPLPITPYLVPSADAVVGVPVQMGRPGLMTNGVSSVAPGASMIGRGIVVAEPSELFGDDEAPAMAEVVTDIAAAVEEISEAKANAKAELASKKSAAMTTPRVPYLQPPPAPAVCRDGSAPVKGPK
eukprot:TRINITY_DN13019_c0_g1_i1.p1 TRINITY_DN13019_c0_g1~~TRINITY_DN13019_c0_g1_i1.p1  ORF type:complete len:788 (+),score=98.16 TRINITY_DN13019_c0_g1_i1:163-2526(+)